MDSVQIRTMRSDEWDSVAQLIFHSTNAWYRSHGMSEIFSGDLKSTRLFCEVYESLDPGCCIVAEPTGGGPLMGSCFYHPRNSHVSLGIMNVNPACFGQGIAQKLLESIIAVSEPAPVRLVSSALNLDSFSLYSRNGFVPQQVFQDMWLPANRPELKIDAEHRCRLRDGTVGDEGQLHELEQQLVGISRLKDFRFILENANGSWHTTIYENNNRVEGFLMSIQHPGSNMIGPGVATDEMVAVQLLAAELNFRRGQQPVFLIPSSARQLLNAVYSWGGRNCELHFSQVRGPAMTPRGVLMPTFMPETG